MSRLNPSVLVLSGAQDPTAEAVISAIRRRGASVCRIDLADFPLRRRLVAHHDDGRWSAKFIGASPQNDPDISLDEVTAIYYRRPSRFVFAPELSDADRAYAEAEARIGVGGVLDSLPCNWVSAPHSIARAEWKPLQLRVAATVGLSVPRSLITNDPESARAFCADAPGPVICKPMSSVVLAEAGQHKITYATRVSETSLMDDQFDSSLAATAHLFQDWVPKEREARLTMIGDVALTAAIDAHSEAARDDWRSDLANITYTRIEAPPTIVRQCRDYLAVFGLRYGAFDFVITPNGEWVMLECNPNGQWLWLHYDAGLPIPEALADLLLAGS